LESLFSGSIAEVVVASPDRFSRFNYDLFEWIFSQYRAKLISLSKRENITSEQELAEDLMSIVTVFAARTHGKRRYNSNQKDKN
jgi:predicted site-specific integrase-resolvase